jgi:hypothetical protein
MLPPPRSPWGTSSRYGPRRAVRPSGRTSCGTAGRRACLAELLHAVATAPGRAATGNQRHLAGGAYHSGRELPGRTVPDAADPNAQASGGECPARASRTRTPEPPNPRTRAPAHPRTRTHTLPTAHHQPAHPEPPTPNPPTANPPTRKPGAPRKPASRIHAPTPAAGLGCPDCVLRMPLPYAPTREPRRRVPAAPTRGVRVRKTPTRGAGEITVGTPSARGRGATGRCPTAGGKRSVKGKKGDLRPRQPPDS